MLNNFIGMIPTPCGQKHVYSALAGAVVAYNPGPVKPATLLSGLPYVGSYLTPMVHYVVAGIAIDMLCRGPDVYSGSKELLMSGGLGLAGALAVSYSGLAK